MARRIGAMGMALASLMLAACGPENELIGTWRFVPEKGNPISEGLNFVMQGQTLVFTGDSMISGGEATKVTYEVAGDRIVVYPEGRKDRGIVYILLGNGRMANELPLGQRVLFERVKG